jgi:L-2,4-diaminobutyrate decarboxylase
MHVDGAYGLAALCAPSVRERFAGIEQADSFIVDPHKWLYAPFDSCALVYREPQYGRAAHRQHASYLESLYADDAAFNPSDYGVHLTRRPRGVPFWFSLAVHGTDAYTEAIERTLALTREAAEEIRARPDLDLILDPELTVLVFRRRGWTAADYDRWAAGLRESGTAFVLPTAVSGEPAARLAIVNPLTTIDDIRQVLDHIA